jgi:hypothetical protein
MVLDCTHPQSRMLSAFKPGSIRVIGCVRSKGGNTGIAGNIFCRFCRAPPVVASLVTFAQRLSKGRI